MSYTDRFTPPEMEILLVEARSMTIVSIGKRSPYLVLPSAEAGLKKDVSLTRKDFRRLKSIWQVHLSEKKRSEGKENSIASIKPTGCLRADLLVLHHDKLL